MPRHIWVVLGHNPSALTITVLAFQMGEYQNALKEGTLRAAEFPGIGGVEAFDLRQPVERLRYHLELWLVGEGVPAEEARSTVVDLARQLSRELKRPHDKYQ